MLMDEALAHYEEREAELTPDVMRQVERQVMLRVIDQRWRAHLYEMDYLREGINLRAMGQKDPLVEWQREGFDMFGQMMHGIWQDFIRYVMHVQVQVDARRRGGPVDARPPPRRMRRARRRDAAAPQDARRLEDDGADAALRLSTRRRTTLGAGGAASMAAAARAEAAATGQAAAGRRRRRRRRPRPRRTGQHAGREVRLGQDAAQRPLPLRLGQEVQAVPRQGLRRVRVRDLSDDLKAPAGPPRRGRGLPEGRRAARPAPPARGRGVAPRPVGRRRPGQAA